MFIITLEEIQMKILEQILLELDAQNLAKAINDINNQLDYYTKYKMEVEGVSLIPVRDLLDPKFTDDVLRKNGYILTIAQFKEDCAKFLELAAKNPILYNSRLKRLHRSYHVLIENYTKGNVHNKAVTAEITKHFAETILASYCNGVIDGKKMPTELSSQIAQTVEEEIGNLNINWYANKLAVDTKKEFTDAISVQLLNDWQKKLLEPAICKQLDEEKTSINSIEALQSHFRERKLPNATQDTIKAAVIEEIKKDIEAGKLTQSNALGAQYNSIRNSILENSHFNVVTYLINNWKNKQVTPDVSHQLEKYISDVIGRMKQNLESSLTQQFEQLATQVFLDKLLSGQYSKDLAETLQKYSLAFAKKILLSLNSDDLKNPSKCKDTVYSQVMNQLHKNWLNGKLSSSVNEFIKESVFAFLNEFDDKIQEQVWPNKNKQFVEKLIRENAEIRNELAGIKKLLAQLVPQNQENAKTAAATNYLPTVDPSPAIPTARLGFFGGK